MQNGKAVYTEEIKRPFLRRYENRLYKTWAGMRHRCNRPGASHFEHYGGRGVKVCKEWDCLEGFQHFAKWALTHGYSDDLEIDRIDTNGEYSPRNCRWVTHKQNSRNRLTYRNAVRATEATSVDDKIIGVIFRPNKSGVGGKWRAMITANGKNISLGTFSKKQDAINARIQGERIYWGGDAI